MTNEIEAYALIELFQDMSRHERENIHVEAQGEWIEFQFEIDSSYYTLCIQPLNGIISLWSDDEQEEIFKVN